MMTDVVIGERFEEVMPQKYPMLMIDSLDSWEFDGAGPSLSGVCSYSAGRRFCTALSADGSLPAWALIEVMAQAVSASAGELCLRGCLRFDEAMAAFDCSVSGAEGSISASAKLIVCRPEKDGFTEMFSRPGRPAPDPALFHIV